MTLRTGDAWRGRGLRNGEQTHRLIQHVGLFRETLCGRRRLLDERRVLLRGAIQMRDRLIDLANPFRLFAAGILAA